MLMSHVPHAAVESVYNVHVPKVHEALLTALCTLAFMHQMYLHAIELTLSL